MTQARKEKLLFVVNEVDFFISHRLPLAIAAQKKGFQVAVAARHAEQNSILAKHRFKSYPLDFSRSGLNVIYELYLLRRIIKKYQPDMVHLVTIKPVLLGGLLARFYRLPKVVYAISGLGFVFIQSGFFANIKKKWVQCLYRLALAHKNSRVIFQNKDDLQLFLDNQLVEKKQNKLIRGSGVDLKVFFPKKTKETKTVTVVLPARMLIDKGVGEFIAAATIIKNQNINAKFLLVGGLDAGGNPSALRAETLKKSNDTEWLGHCSDMVAIFQDADIVCLPSYREGLPKALIEACACGKAIVTSDAPGCREIVDVDKNGFLVPVGDAKALADALLVLIKDENLRDTFGQHSLAKAKKEFTIETVVQETMAVYDELNALIK